eukprot:gene1182-10696_t
MSCQHNCCFKQCSNKCTLKGEHTTHFCNSSHPCTKKCDEIAFPGHCSIDKSIDLGKSKTQLGRRENCAKIIEPFKLEHEGHCCHSKEEKDTFHYCDVACPGCGFICQKEYGHKDKHDLKEHGKMFNLMFVSSQKEQTKLQFEDKTTMNFYQGQICKNFKCHEYCKRFGRGHYHYNICGSNEGSVCDQSLFNVTGVKHVSEKISKEYPNIDQITHEAYWDMIHFKDPYQTEAFNTCEHKNIFGNPCTRSVGHSKIDVYSKDFVSKITEISEQLPEGILSADGHRYDYDNNSDHHIILIDSSKMMALNDVSPTNDILKEKEFSFLNSRYGVAFELALRYTHIKYKLKSQDKFSLILFNSRKGNTILCENEPIKNYYSIIDFMILSNKLDQRPSFSPVLELCHDLVSKYKKPTFFLMFTAASPKGIFKSKGSSKLEILKKKFKTDDEFKFQIIQIGEDLISEDLRDMLIVTKQKILNHTSKNNILPILINSTTIGSNSIVDSTNKSNDSTKGVLLTLSKTHIKIKEGTNEQARANLALEILETETAFVTNIGKTLELYYYPLFLNPIVSKSKREEVFSGLENIYKLNSKILVKFKNRIDHWHENPRIGDLFVEFSPYLKIYTTYFVKYEKSLNWILQQSKKDSKFETFLNLRRGDKFMTEGSKITSFLITPIQRIPRYKLLLQEMLKKSPSDHIDFNDLKQALCTISDVADYLNLQVQSRNKFTKMKKIASKLLQIDDIIIKNRRFIQHERVLEKTSLSTTNCVLFLFNDILVHSLEKLKIGPNQFQSIHENEQKNLDEILSENEKNEIHFEVKYFFKISEIEFEESNEKNLILKSKDKKIEYSFESIEKKENWLKEFKIAKKLI